jgi:coenzyme F420 hydrogenase subunit beta
VADVLQKDLCIGCGACTELCPYFKNYKGRTSMLFSCTNKQGRCYAHCPKAEVDLDELSGFIFGKPYAGNPLGEYRKVLISKAGPNMSSGKFQSGGTVSALITYALREGMIDAAVLTDQKGLIPVPQLVSKPEDVVHFASSKYMSAPTVSALHQAQEQGYQRVGVVGTPCQLTAIAKIRTNPLRKEDFQDPVGLTIGLFCTWALDTRNLLQFLSERVDIHKIEKMDIPPPPAEILIVTLDDGEIEIPLSEIRELIPNSCSICPDMTAEWADLSAGVLEGKPGWNTLIIRTPKGEELVAKAEKAGFLITGEMRKENLEHLSMAAGNKKSRAIQRAVQEGLLNTSGNVGRAAFRMNDSTYQRLHTMQGEE